MTVSQTPRTLTLEEEQALWRAKNRNAVREIANMFGLSYVFVRRVLIGELTSGERRVERELARRGCPGFSEAERAA